MVIINNYGKVARLVYFLSLLSLLSGCASLPDVDSKLAVKFTPHLSISANESLVYVIRENTLQGGGRVLEVGLNNKIVAEPAYGTYTYFKINDDANTVSVRQGVTRHFYRLDNRKGEIIFLHIKYEGLTFTELNPELGKTVVMKYSQCEPLKDEFSTTAHQESLLDPSLVGLYLMKENKELIKPDNKNAVITFIRPDNSAKDKVVAIWTDKAFIGNLKSKTYFQIKVPVGKYCFYSTAGTNLDSADTLNWINDSLNKQIPMKKHTWLTADIEPGKEYFAKMVVFKDGSEYRLQLSPVKSDIKSDSIKAWMKNSMGMALDSGAMDIGVQKRIKQALPLVQNPITTLLTTKKTLSQDKSFNLEPADGRSE